MSHQVILGFDFGMKRIGTAIGQTFTHTAHPLKTLQAKDGVPQWDAVAQIIQEWGPDAIVVGLPTHLDNTEQHTTRAARALADELEKRFQLPVYLQDERLTTVAAREAVFETGGYKQLKKTAIDSVAAQIILEAWMNEHDKHP